VMGTGAYGRTFTLADPSCVWPGCLFNGPGKEGPCTKGPGILAYFEIVNIIATNKNAIKVYDVESMSNYLTFDN
jgi:chitinase